MEIDTLSECSAETETTDGSSKVEAEMNALVNDSGKTKLP
jgi:hypothetical protein